jgi:hypothetical protein
MALTKVTYSMIAGAPLNVIDFIPANTNTATTNCASFFNAAVIAAAGQRPIYVPSGTYLITSPIELNWSTEVGTIYEQATQLIGQSTVDTIILNRSGDYGLKHTVTSAQAQQAGAGKRMTNGVLCNFTITTDGSSPAGSAGIELFSFWFGYIHDINVASSKEHGIYLPVDTAISANPDNYSCAQLKVERCDIRSSTGWGVKAEMYSITWLLDSNYIVNNALGGVYTAGTGHQITNNAIAGNGTNSSSVGLYIAYAGVGTPHNVYIRDNEMDNNWGMHIALEGYSHIVEQNRFIQDATQGTGGIDYRNDYCIVIDPTLTGLSQCVVNQNTFRFDNPGTATLTAIYIVPVAGATGNQCINNIFVTKPANVVTYSFPSSRARNFAVEDGLQLSGGNESQYSYGQMTVVTPASTVMTTAGALLAFTTTYDPQTRWFGSTNQFYVPLYSGVLRIDANLLIKHVTTANTAVTIQIKQNGSTIASFYYPSGFPATGLDYSIAFTHVMKIGAGDQITIFGVATTASDTFSISGTSSVTFQML